MAEKSTHTLRVAETGPALYLAFDPPLPPAVLDHKFAHPYGSYTNSEEAGWPQTAIVEDRPDQLVIGLFKYALLMRARPATKAKGDTLAIKTRLGGYVKLLTKQLAAQGINILYDTGHYSLSQEDKNLVFKPVETMADDLGTA